MKAQAATASCSLPSQNYGKGLLILSLMGFAGLITLALSLITLSTSTHPALFHFHFEEDDVDEGNRTQYESRIKEVFEKASMPNRTVILATLNGAWANEGTMINLFLESFWIGYGTQRLLQHLVFICVDEKAYEQCLVIHPHCLIIKTHDVNLSQEPILLSNSYIELVLRRIKFLTTVVHMNFNFIFTHTDMVWFRDPFPLLENDTNADIQISTDHYIKNPWDISNKPNMGFMYVRANGRTLNFFKYWYEERKRYSNHATQRIFEIIKFDETFKNIDMKLHFLDPQLFVGFCRIRHSDMTKSITMHATCCKSQEAKLIDLRMILKGWKKWKQLYTTKYPQYLKSSKSHINQSTLPPEAQKYEMSPHFDVPSTCIQSLKIKSN